MIGSIDKYKATLPTLNSSKPKSNGGFLDELQNKMGGIVDQLHEAERVGIAGASNKTDLHTLVTSFSVAESNLRMLVSITEKVSMALQDITKMQI